MLAPVAGMRSVGRRERQPESFRPGLLPPGTAPFTLRIKREIEKRKAKVRADLVNADHLHYPKDDVEAVLEFWKIVLVRSVFAYEATPGTRRTVPARGCAASNASISLAASTLV